MKTENRTNTFPGMLLRMTLLAAILIVLSPAAKGQNITFRGGVSTMLYDDTYFPDLYGEGVSPVFPSFGARVGWQDRSGSPYAVFCHEPEFGLGLQVDAMGTFKTASSPGIGNIYSLYGYFDRALIVTNSFRFGYTVGGGLGCSFSHLYHPERNPANWLLSLPVNARINLGLQAKVFLSSRFFVGAGAYFNHTSNGAVQFPNRGVNAFEFALFAGMAERQERRKLSEREDDGFRRKFQFEIQLSGGIMSNEAYFEHRLENEGVWDNVHRFKGSLSVGCLYQYSRMHASGLGADMFVTPFCDEIARYDRRGDQYDPVSVGISALHEMRYRNMALMVGLGRYLYDNDGLARNKTFYQLVSVRYHMPALADVFVGAVLKAHKFRAAESVQICLGKRF